MLKKIKLLLISLVGMFFLTGCGVDNIKVNNPLNENEIISYVQKQIYSETSDNVIVKIISKEDLEVCTDWFGGCVNYQKVDNGYSYTLEITNKDNTNIIATGTYNDGYIIYDDEYTDGKSIKEIYFESDYKEQKGLNLIKNEFTNTLNEKFDKYYLYKDVSNDEGYDIFINSSNYSEINSLLSSFNDIIIKYRDYVYTCYSVYIYKDENVFNSTNFELYNNGTEDYDGQSYGKDMIEQYTGKEVTRIGYSNGFNYDLFMSNGASAAETYDEYVDYNTFDYLVFWYDAEPNSFVGANSPQLQIFGVK